MFLFEDYYPIDNPAPSAEIFRIPLGISDEKGLQNILRMAFPLGILLIFSVSQAQDYAYLLAYPAAVLMAMPRQWPESLRAQFPDPEAAALAQTLQVGEAITNFPSVHKLKLLYLSPETEKRVIAAQTQPKGV